MMSSVAYACVNGLEVGSAGHPPARLSRPRDAEAGIKSRAGRSSSPVASFGELAFDFSPALLTTGSV
jgi:hypothetical protein